MIVNNLKKLEFMDGTKSLSSIQSDYIDNEIYRDAVKDIKELQEEINEKTYTDTPFCNKLGQDLFNSLYKISPKLYNKENVVNSLHLEHDILSNIVNGSSFEDLRRTTAGDLFNSTFAVNVLLQEANKSIVKFVRESEENAKLMTQVNEIIDKQNVLDNLKEALENDPDNEEFQLELEKIQQEVDDMNKQLNDSGNVSNLQDAISNAVDSTKNKVNDNNDIMNCFFTNGETGSLSAMPYKDRVILSNKLKDNTELKEIAKQLGRMKQMLNKVNKKPHDLGYETVDVTLGNRLSKILSSEKVLLSEPLLENQFYKKYTNKSLMQYKTKGAEEMQGPIIVCVDDSGSMEGERDYWAKAIAIALLQIAVKQKREYRCILFDTKVNKVYDFDKKNFTPERVFEMASYFNGGGTNFTHPLRKALESIEDSRYKKADIVFITDGESSIDGSFLTKFKLAQQEKEFFVQGIIIEGYRTGNMNKFCDNVINFKDLNKDNQLVNIFSNVQNKERTVSGEETE